MFPELLAALSGGQRAIAHLVVLLVVPVTAGLVYLIRRKAGSPDQTRETQRTSGDG